MASKKVMSYYRSAIRVAITPESSYYPVAVYIELPFYNLCRQFIIITVFISAFWSKALLFHVTLTTNTKINQFCYKSLENHLEDIGTIQKSKLVLKT